jgi:hypothetical protein
LWIKVHENRCSHDAYEAYTRNWPASPEEVQDLRGRLLALGAFSERGTYTLRAAVTKDDADLIRKAHTLLLDGITHLVSKLRAPIEE